MAAPGTPVKAQPRSRSARMLYFAIGRPVVDVPCVKAGRSDCHPTAEDSTMLQQVCVRTSGLLLIPLLLLATGCGGHKWGRKQAPEPPPEPRSRAVSSAVARGTIGAQTLFADTAPRIVRGFGLVVGLGDAGSSQCPAVVREYLIEFFSKQLGPGPSRETAARTPGELIDAPSTAVVEVFGSVPAGARHGERFDLLVVPIPESGTRSLEGGLLLPTELRLFQRDAAGRGLIAGRVLAEAGGPVFTDPVEKLLADQRPQTEETLRGYVLGGGRALEARSARIMLMQPSYQLAKAIQRRINERFGSRDKPAQAQSRGYLTLDTPSEYAGEAEYFRRLVSFLYVDNTPAFREKKRRELTRMAAAGGEHMEPIALAWEGLGRSVISHIQPFYTAANSVLRYYAARTGARLGDPLAVPPLADVANDPNNLHRLDAIGELGFADSPQAARFLVPLLEAADAKVRVAAYEALLRHRHPIIESIPFRHILDNTQLNCILDIVDCDGPPLIHVRRTGVPRIALFGLQTPVLPPVFLTSEDEAVTIVSREDSNDVHVYAKANGQLSEEILVPPRATELIMALADLPLRDDTDRLRGIGLPYSRVVQVLADLCTDEVIPAKFLLEYTPLEEFKTPERRPERPEAEPYEPNTTPDVQFDEPTEPVEPIDLAEPNESGQPEPTTGRMESDQ